MLIWIYWHTQFFDKVNIQFDDTENNFWVEFAFFFEDLHRLYFLIIHRDQNQSILYNIEMGIFVFLGMWS